MSPPEYELAYRCTKDGTQWEITARVIRDDECPRCGLMHLPIDVKQTREFSE